MSLETKPKIPPRFRMDRNLEAYASLRSIENIQFPVLTDPVSEALFCLCRGANIYNSFGGVSEFQDTYHGFLYFLTFLVFLSGFFILLVREKHRKTLYRFLLAKIKGWDRNNRDKNSEHDNNNKNK